MEERKIKYSYVILEEYKPLEDGSPNLHYNPAVRVSGEGTLKRFLDGIVANSNTEGLSIVKAEYEFID